MENRKIVLKKDFEDAFKKLGLQEGDNVIVGVYIDMNAATDNGYNIKELEKEYVLIEQENNQ